MADTIVSSNTDINLSSRNLGLQGPYWINTEIAVIVYVDSSGNMKFSRTINGGINWTEYSIASSTTQNLACWFDKETPSNFGTELHIVWLDASNPDGSREAFYVNIDISDGSKGTIRTIYNTLTLNTLNPTGNKISITKSVGGNLLVAFKSDGSENKFFRSIDSGDNWVSRDDPFETTSSEDWILLYPANTSDNQDVCCIYWDESANDISIKMYDDSADNWSETIINTSMTDDFKHINMDAVIRHSDNHILLAAHSNDDYSTDSLLTWELIVDSINSPTILNKTNVFTNQAEAAQVAMLINQQNDDVYISYLKGGVWESLSDVVFHKSIDGMMNWGTEQPYSETQDDARLVHGGRTIGDDGGRVQWSWHNTDTNQIFVNLVSDIEISSVGNIYTSPKVKIAGTFTLKPVMVKIDGTFVEKIMKVRVSGIFQ